MKTMLIKAVKTDEGYRLIPVNGEIDGSRTDYADVSYKSRSSLKAAYADARLMWPSDSDWNGRKVKGGYRINID